LANPARAQYQLIGAPSTHAARIMAEALGILGTEHSFVVHGSISPGKGLDELSTVGPSDVFEVRANRVEAHSWTPEDFGIQRAQLADLAGGDAAENAAIIQDILAGARGPRRDIAVLNAAAALLACGRETSPGAAIKAAADSLDAGRAEEVLQKLQQNFPAA
jgi:anthranilate phosphoribosyltransferase